jgi:hypothetical protein
MNVIFFALGRGIVPWWPTIFGALFMIATVAVYIRRENLMYDRSPGGRIVVCVMLAIFSIVLFFGSGIKVYLEKKEVEEALAAKTYKIVNGLATKYKPPFKDGDLYERFCVVDQCFKYSDYIPSFGFHDTKIGSGPMREGLHVQVHYVGNIIFKLEVAPEPRRLPAQE